MYNVNDIDCSKYFCKVQYLCFMFEIQPLRCCYLFSDFRPIQSFTEKAESSPVTNCANFGTDGVEDRAATEDSWPGQR